LGWMEEIHLSSILWWWWCLWASSRKFTFVKLVAWFSLATKSIVVGICTNYTRLQAHTMYIVHWLYNCTTVQLWLWSWLWYWYKTTLDYIIIKVGKEERLVTSWAGIKSE
jgi:hypothetical protein